MLFCSFNKFSRFSYALPFIAMPFLVDSNTTNLSFQLDCEQLGLHCRIGMALKPSRRSSRRRTERQLLFVARQSRQLNAHSVAGHCKCRWLWVALVLHIKSSSEYSFSQQWWKDLNTRNHLNVILIKLPSQQLYTYMGCCWVDSHPQPRIKLNAGNGLQFVSHFDSFRMISTFNCQHFIFATCPHRRGVPPQKTKESGGGTPPPCLEWHLNSLVISTFTVWDSNQDNGRRCWWLKNLFDMTLLDWMASSIPVH